MVRILTDSSSDILPAEAEGLGIEVIPLNVTFEDGSCVRDNVDLTTSEFYEELKACNKLPRTSQPSPEAFAAYFAEAKAAGDETVVLLLGSTLSGTMQAALIGADDAEYTDAHFVDTETVTMGLYLLVHRAIQLRSEGKSAAEIAATLEVEKDAVRIYAVISDLKYLHKGGRLPAAVAVVGGALGIKPVVCLHHGKIHVVGKGRGLPGAFVALFKHLENEGGIAPGKGIVYGYTDSKGLVEPISHYVTGNLKMPHSPTIQVGCTIGTHIGPGGGGLAFFVREPEEPQHKK